MLTLNSQTSHLLVIDLQPKLVPVIHNGDAAAQNTSHLINAARRLDVPVAFTEQNPKRLGHTLPQLAPDEGEVLDKMSFDALRNADIAKRLQGERQLVVTGCEAHVCVLQTVLGLLQQQRAVAVVADAIGSRDDANRLAALDRMARHGAEIVTTEMVLFEWLGSADNPAFRQIVSLIK